MSDLVAVVYIGAKAVKKDNVLRTRRIWEGRGAKVECPREDAEVYFSYRDIWAPPEVAAKMIKAAMNESETSVVIQEAPEKKTAEAKIDTSDRAALIQGAILQLDQKNEQHYTGQGKPRVKAVVDILGMSVEAGEIDNALKDLRASGKIPEPA